MRFMIVCLAAVLATATAAPSAVRAEDAPQAAAASPRQLALTRRYVELMMSDQLEDAIRGIVESEAMGQTRDMPEEDRRFLVDLTTELTADMIPQMVEEIIPVYARVFSEAELEALLAFYDTEIGRSIIAKTVQSMPEANAAAMAVMPQLMEKMAARICQHYGCEPGELEELQREMRGQFAVAPTRRK